ncbi:MAG: hypothetical protein AAGA76_08815 [Pseudomonadota bacterium]
MTYPALPSVECAILHDEFKPIDGDIIFDAIKKLAIELKFANEVNLMVTSTEKDIHVHAAGHRILVSQNPDPLGMEGFRNALTTPYTGMVLPNATEIVQRHKANTFVTVGKGLLPINDPDIGGKLQEMLGDHFESIANDNQFASWQEAERAMILCRELTKLIISHHQASAIHWCTSDNLIPQNFFEGVASMDDFAMLGARPYLTSSAGQLGEGLPVGAIFNGSQWLIGKMVSFEEAVVPLPWMLEMVMGFIKVCQVRGSIIPHMESFGVEGEDWRVGVVHEKIEGHDKWEMVKLVLIHAPQFGIHGDDTAKRTFTYENEDDVRARAEAEKNEVRAANDVAVEENNVLDPDNEMDLAIMEKLRKREEDVQQKELSEAPAPKTQEPWEGRKRGSDMEALRELANRNRAEREAQEADAEKKGGSLLGKVSGLFSRK